MTIKIVKRKMIAFNKETKVMQLPTIEIRKLTTNESDHHKKGLSNVTSLSKSALDFLAAANSHYDSIPLIFLGLSGKSLDIHKKELVLLLEAIDVDYYISKVKKFSVDRLKIKLPQ